MTDYYYEIHPHVERHPKIRQALIDQCVHDDANTIWSAIQQMSKEQFDRGLSRMLARHFHNSNFEEIPDSERTRVARKRDD